MFKAIAPGETVISTNHADNLPLNAVTMLGIDGAVNSADIQYETARIVIVPEPSSLALLISTFGMLLIHIASRRQEAISRYTA